MDTLSSTTMDECMSADAKAKIIQAQFLRSPKNHHEAQTTPAAALRLILNDPAWSTEASTLELLEPGMMQLAAHYLIRMKKRGKALCPVGNFHVRNGAILERINWFADPSVKVCLSLCRSSLRSCLDLYHLSVHRDCLKVLE